MNFSDYRALPAVNASSLKHMAASPLRYRYFLDNPTPDSPAMQLGRAVHTAVLEPDEFVRRYTTWHAARRGKDWTDFSAAAESAGLEVLTNDEYDKCLAIRDAVRSHPVAQSILAGAATEQTLTWTDDETGLPCKCRCDILKSGLVADLKTARAIDPRQFGRATFDLLYHVQAAHYLAGYRANYTVENPAFAFIAVESSAPFDVRAGLLSEDALALGEDERRRLLNLVAECQAADRWPGAYEDESEFDLPIWAYPSVEEITDAITVTRSAS